MAMKPFLLNPDGTLPAHLTAAQHQRLIDAGVTFILPTDPGTPAPGCQKVETNPAQDDQGVWRQVWVDVPAEPAPPEPVPQTLSAFRAKAALVLSGKMPDVRAHIATLPPDDLVRLAWESNEPFSRQSPAVIAIGAALGLDLDGLFVTGAKINV